MNVLCEHDDAFRIPGPLQGHPLDKAGFVS